MTSHLFRLNTQGTKRTTEGGVRVTATKSNFPHLQGMSFYRLTLFPNAIREPHWHANADELGYCLEGKVLVSFFASGNKKETFIVNAGEVFYIPSGTLHAIENANDDSSQLILQFSHEEPEDFALSTSLGMFSDAVLGNTWNEPAEKFHDLKRSAKSDVFIALNKQPLKLSKEVHYPSAYKFNLQGSGALISQDGGFAKVSRQDVWPILKRQALYSLVLNGAGMREPHWHPETAELGFVHKGKGRMSIMSPDGNVDTYEMNEGDIYFIPKAYPHHIENLTDGNLELLIFFDQAMPGDIGFTASIKSFSDTMLTDVMKCPKDLFASLPTYYQDLFIVNKCNKI